MPSSDPFEPQRDLRHAAALRARTGCGADARSDPRASAEPAAAVDPSGPRSGPVEIDVLILRDPRESVRKCSLTPLRGLPGIRFVDYRPDRLVDAGERVLLHPDGEELGPADGVLGLLVVDCAWRRVDALLRTVRGTLHARRLPPLRTAYPRRSRTFEDPASGLASVEALYAALARTGRQRPDLLAAYRWREEFLAANPALARDGR